MILVSFAVLVTFAVFVLVFAAGVRVGRLITERNIAVAELKDLRRKNGLD